MTLKDTCPIELKDKSHLIRLVNVLLAAESEATEQYEQVLNALEGTSYHEVRTELEEIKKDELNHVGILIKLISQLDPSAGLAMIEGAKENA